MTKLNLIFIVSLFLLGSCASIYNASNLNSKISSHKTVAILPFEVVIQFRKFPKNVTLDYIRKLQEDEGFNTQSLCFSRFLQKSADYTILFQDVNKTNSILKENGINYEDLRGIDKGKIAILLGVDAVISGSISRHKPMSEAGALLTGVLLGYFGPTNQVFVYLTIHDGEDATLLWKYEHTLSGSLGSNSKSLTKSLLSKISRIFPYLKSNQIKTTNKRL